MRPEEEYLPMVLILLVSMKKVNLYIEILVKQKGRNASRDAHRGLVDFTAEVPVGALADMANSANATLVRFMIVTDRPKNRTGTILWARIQCAKALVHQRTGRLHRQDAQSCCSQRIS